MSTSVEFYAKQGNHLVATVRNIGAVPVVGHFINIRQKTYAVIDVTWAVDNSNDSGLTANLRANITLEEF